MNAKGIAMVLGEGPGRVLWKAGILSRGKRETGKREARKTAGMVMAGDPMGGAQRVPC